jgi:hypothetical protein
LLAPEAPLLALPSADQYAAPAGFNGHNVSFLDYCLLNNEWTRTQRSRRSGTKGTAPLGLKKVDQFRFTYCRSLAPQQKP